MIDIFTACNKKYVVEAIELDIEGYLTHLIRDLVIAFDFSPFSFAGLCIDHNYLQLENEIIHII
ncbi:MAG: hypothetical protein ACOVRK_16030, partial [Chryseobacterium taeanense]